HFGERVFDKAVHISCLWTSRSTDASASTMPRTSSAPVLGYVPRQRVRSNLIAPADADRDPRIVAILLAMAQAHFYNKTSLTPPSSLQPRSSSGRRATRMPILPFYDVTGQVITHHGEGESANFVVYTAVVTATFLSRFMLPHKGLDSEDSKSGMEISVRKVKVFPILGLRERLARALLPEIAWDPLVEASCKRKRAGNGSFEVETPPRGSAA
ncbi:hypothetical protein N658DRAFT_435335, partial [Parathielavia hyrcaniae]